MMLPMILKEVQRELLTDPDNPQLNKIEGDIYIWESRFEEAVPLYEKLVELIPYREEFRITLAKLYRSFGDYRSAAEQYAKLTMIDPYNKNYRITRGDILAQGEVGDEEERISPPEEAKEAWESIIETDPNDLSLYKELAAIYWDYYMFDEAIQSILRAREVSRNENLFAGELAALYELKGAYTQAIDEYIRILETGQEPESGHYYEEYTPTERKLLYLIDEEEMFPLIEERFEKAIASRPTSGKLYLELARLYLYLEKSDKALSTYQRGSEAIEDIDFHLNLADIYGGYRRFDLQERELLYVVEKRPKDITYLGLLAGFYMNRERYDKASEICRRMVEIEPAEESHRASLAKALLELEEFEEAEEIYLALVEADPTNISYYTQLAIAYYRQGRGEEGIEIYNRGIKRLSQDESLKNAMNTLKVRQIYLYSALGMYIDGLAAYERMINKEPLVEWILDSAYRLAKEHNLLDKLISYYQEVSAEAHRNYRWNVVLYRIFMKENRYQEALLQLEKAVGLEPSLVWLRQELAEQYRRLGKYQKAVEQYEEIIFLGGEPWSWYEAIGYTYAEAGDLENAKVWWAKLAERSPNEPYTHSKLASLYERYRLFDDAIAGYEKAAKLAEARKNYSLGFYESIGRVYEAQRDYMKAIDIYISLYGRSSSSYSRERYLEMIFDVYEKLDNLNSVIEGYQKNLPANLSNVAYLKLFARICLLQNNYEKALELYKRALEIASSDKADPYSAIADIYLPRKMYKEAIEIYNKLLLLNPAEGGYYGHIGECYFELGDETEACLYWQSIPDLGERDPMRYGQLGEIYFREGMYREAKEQLSKALFLAESYQKGTYYEQLGEIYFAEGDKDKAVETWRKIVEANPEDAQLYFRLADVFRDHKLYLPAVSALEEVLLLYRGKEYHYRWRDADEEIDNIYEEAKRFDLLIAKYKERIANPITEDEYRDYLNYLNLLSAYNKNGDYQSAITTAKEALTILEKEISESELLVREVIQTDGKRIKLLSELAKAYKESRDYEKAIDTYELLLDLDPQNNFHYVNLGEIYFAQGDKEKALAIWRKMVEVNPNQSSTYQQLAETLDKYEFYGEAEESWRKAIILDPNIMLYRYNLAETLFLERNYQSAIAIYLELLYISDDLEIRKKAEEGLFKAYVEGNLLDSAIAEFSERVQHLPELVEPRLALGLAYQLKGEFDRALAVYQEAQGVDPYNLEGHFQLAVIYRIKGDSYEADRELERLFMLNPERYEDFERRYKKRLAELGITYKPYEMPEPKLLIALRSYAPAWSPDGKRIAFHSALVEGENSDIWVYDLETGRSTQLTNTPGSDRFASWSPDGEWVTFQTQDESGKWGIWKVRTDAGSLSKIIADEKFSYHDPAWSKVGNWIAFYSNIRGNYDIWMVNPEGRMLTQLTQESFSDRSPSWSSEGKKIAFQSNRDGTNEIWVLDVESGAFEQITDNDRNNDMPAFSPDGGKIAFFSNASGDWDIWMINIDGTGARRLTDEAGIDFNPVWSPDGKRIAFESNRGGKNQIWVIEIAEDS